MKQFNTKRNPVVMGLCAGLVASVTLLLATPSHALDAAYSRKGPFTGVGLGGGAALLGTDTATGDLAMNLQVGLGASEAATVSLNLDMRLDVGNDIKQGLIVPGPSFAFFFNKNLYMDAGVGLAAGISAEPTNENVVGMNVGVGVGYEHFVNTNIAGYISGGADYYLLNDATDMVVFSVMLGIRYY